MQGTQNIRYEHANWFAILSKFTVLKISCLDAFIIKTLYRFPNEVVLFFRIDTIYEL